MKEYLDCDIAVIEQGDGKPFNRGKLLNCGFLELPHYPYYVFHDVDMLPVKVDYSNIAAITQLASSDIQKVDYLGGVTSFYKEFFLMLGGYSNNFYSRAEDNEMMFNIKRHHIKIKNKFGIFETLPHERTGVEFDPVLWKKAQQPRINDGLPHTEYRVIHKENFPLYKHIIVEL